jgi:hypothetical protein
LHQGKPPSQAGTKAPSAAEGKAVAWEHRAYEVNVDQKPRQPLLPGFGIIFRATRTTRSGRVLVARDYGYRGWPMVVWVG